MVCFNRTAVSQFLLGSGIVADNVTLTVAGQLNDGTPFKASQTMQVRMPGDLNMDDKVDILDIAAAASAFGSYPDHDRWNPVADENEDGVINIFDLIPIAQNFGKTYP